MSIGAGTEIFWTTVVAVPVILAVATIIGRVICGLYPYMQKPLVKFYLSPTLGLAFLQVISSYFGRYCTIGKLSAVLFLMVLVILLGLIYLKVARDVLSQAMALGIFGLACGISILVPLYFMGGFNAHNDAFTYLEHSQWLQRHAFNRTIASHEVTPSTTQVFLYQVGGYRMGASYLLALFQSLSRLPWSYDIYPAANICAITSCCMGVGLVIHKELARLKKGSRYLLLVLPAFGYGGIVFAANTGFLPQMYGLTFASGLLFLLGMTFQGLSTRIAFKSADLAKAAIPASLLLSSSMFTYPELSPFIIIAILSSGVIMGIRLKAFGNLFVFYCGLFVLSVLLLNTELLRALAAIRSQSGAVVGGPVTWPLIGFLAHALGVHGGTFGDVFQWSIEEHLSYPFILGGVLLVLFLWVIWSGFRLVVKKTQSGLLLPTVTVLSLFVAGLLYFRYAVASPFPVGVGQSWSQFKLSEWTHPFLTVLVLCSIAELMTRTRHAEAMLVLVVMAGMFVSGKNAMVRMIYVKEYYKEVRDLSSFYKSIREAVYDVSPANEPIFLELNGDHHKFRQMVSLYLFDRELHSDWSDDGYLVSNLPEEIRRKELKYGNCVVEPIGFMSDLSQARAVGGFRIGVLKKIGHLVLSNIETTYQRESDGESWWYWVDHKISFGIRSHELYKSIPGVDIDFQYAARVNQILTVKVYRRDGVSIEFRIPAQGDALRRFDTTLNISAADIAAVSVETDGIPYALGHGDGRVAAFMIRNMTIRPIPIATN